jgi:hypothetical protein
LERLQKKVFFEARPFRYKLTINDKRAFKEITIDKAEDYIKLRKSWNQGNSLVCRGKKLVPLDFNYKDRGLDEIVEPEFKWRRINGKLFEKHPYDQDTFPLVTRYESSALVASIMLPKKRTINWIILFVQFCKNWNINLVEEANQDKLHKDFLMGIVYFSFQNYKPAICWSEVQWKNKKVFNELLTMLGQKTGLVGLKWLQGLYIY